MHELRPFALRARLAACAALFIASTPQAADPLPTESFFRPADNQMVRVSPTGRYLALTAPAAEGSRLAIIDMASMKVTAVFSVMRQHHVDEFFWVDAERVVFNTYKKLGSVDFPIRHDEWFAGNADQSKYFSIGDIGQVIGRDRDNPGRVIVVAGEVYSLDTYEDDHPRRFREVSRLNAGTRAGLFLLDSTYRARVAEVIIESVLRDISIRVRERDKAAWREVRTVPDPTRQVFDPLAMAPDDERVYVASNDGATTVGMTLWDPRSGKSELVFRHPDVDIAGLVHSADGRTPIGVEYVDDRQRTHFFDKKHPDGQLYREIAALYPEQQVSFTSFSDDRQQAVVLTWSDVDPGSFHLLDVKAGTVKPLVARMPWIDPRQMAPMRPITLKARDGTPLHGYLTVPRDTGKARLPTIVLVHGGPHARDDWGFDPEVQFLANRGYAVLQVNFRGSSGYGKAFERASELRWGLEPQDDVTDATRWAVAQGIADPDRICIYGASYGASYGAYSALMGVIREPALYRCAAGNAGVYDLSLLKYDGDTAEDTLWGWGTEYLQRELGKDKQTARDRSPVNLAKQVRVPVFLAHGGKDRRAPVRQFHKMKDALEDAGATVDTALFDNEGHGFSDPKNQVQYYDKLAEFFARHTAPRTSGSGGD
jgi:dipeptidyl aminopeptidase/acylaminoacyl peptidase